MLATFVLVGSPYRQILRRDNTLVLTQSRFRFARLLLSNKLKDQIKTSVWFLAQWLLEF